MVDLVLHPPTLKDISSIALPPQFVFHIDDRDYYTQLVLAVSVSPFLANLVKEKTYEYTFSTIKDPHHYFELVINLFNGETIDINHDNSFFLNAVAKLLGITSLDEETAKICQGPITTADVFNVLTNFGEHHLNGTYLISKICKNWLKFENSPELLHLPLHTLELIFSDESFEPSCQAALFDLITRIVEKNGHEYTVLYKYCYFEDLSVEAMKKFISVISYDDIHPEVIRSLRDRLILDLDFSEEEEEVEENHSNNMPYMIYQDTSNGYNNVYNPPRNDAHVNQYYPSSMQQPVYIPPPQAQPDSVQPISSHQMQDDGERETIKIYLDEDYPAAGVIAHLFEMYPSNSIGQVITYKAGGSKLWRLNSLFDQKVTTYWDNFDGNSCKKENAWLIIEFPYHTLQLSHYTLGSPATKANVHQPKSWVVEGSNDGVNWAQLHKVKNSKRMNAKLPIQNFDLVKKTAPYHQFRLTMLENYAKPSSGSMYEFCLSILEFFGDLTVTDPEVHNLD